MRHAQNARAPSGPAVKYWEAQLVISRLAVGVFGFNNLSANGAFLTSQKTAARVVSFAWSCMPFGLDAVGQYRACFGAGVDPRAI